MKIVFSICLILAAVLVPSQMTLRADGIIEIPWGQFCRRVCDDDQQNCHNRAGDFLRRCERYSEEAQCYEHYQFKIRICNLEFERCMRVCGSG